MVESRTGVERITNRVHLVKALLPQVVLGAIRDHERQQYRALLHSGEMFALPQIPWVERSKL
jgi:hypothetical protein